jgi:hypothetical protein
MGVAVERPVFASVNMNRLSEMAEARLQAFTCVNAHTCAAIRCTCPRKVVGTTGRTCPHVCSTCGLGTLARALEKWRHKSAGRVPTYAHSSWTCSARRVAGNLQAPSARHVQSRRAARVLLERLEASKQTCAHVPRTVRQQAFSFTGYVHRAEDGPGEMSPTAGPSRADWEQNGGHLPRAEEL